MTISVKCSGCESALKAGDHLAGKQVKCPKCNAVIAIPATEEDLEEAPASYPRAKKATTAAPSGQKQMAPAPDEDEPADDDGDEEKKPRKKSKKPRKEGGSAKTLLIVGVGCGLLAVLFLGGAALGLGIWWKSRPDSTSASNTNKPDPDKPDPDKPGPKEPVKPSGSSDLLFCPDGAVFVSAERVEDVIATPFFQGYKNALGNRLTPNVNEEERKYGLSMLNNVERRVMFRTGGTTPAEVHLIRTRAAVKANDIKAFFKSKDPAGDFAEVKAGKYTIVERKTTTPGAVYEPLRCFAITDDRTVIYGNQKELTAVCVRDKEATLTTPMKEALAKADFSKSSVAVAEGSGVQDLGRNASIFNPGAGRFEYASLSGVQPVSVVAQLTLTGDLQVVTTATFKDADSAARVKKTVDGIKSGSDSVTTTSLDGAVLVIDRKTDGQALLGSIQPR
jgi:hypothetical protein